MEKKYAKIYVMNNGKVIDTAVDMDEVNEILTRIAGGAKDFDFESIKLLNVIDEMPLDIFAMNYAPGDVNIGDEDVSDGEIEYKINSGNFAGRAFDDLTDLQDFFREKIEDGFYTVEEVKEIEVIKEVTDTVYFSEAWQENGEWRIDLDKLSSEGEALYNRMGVEFVTAEEADKELKALTDEHNEAQTIAPTGQYKYTEEHLKLEVDNQVEAYLKRMNLVNLDRNIDMMDDDDINIELAKVLQRAKELQIEKREREAARINNMSLDELLEVNE